MAAQVGDRIIVESQKVGGAAREGEILVIPEACYGTRYRLRVRALRFLCGITGPVARRASARTARARSARHSSLTTDVAT